MKKIFFHICGVAVVLLALSVNVKAQKSNFTLNETFNRSAYSRISATIVRSYEASETMRLRFGTLLPKGPGSRIKITPDGKREIYGNIGVRDNAYSPARYYISGANYVFYKVILPDSPVVLTNSGNSSKTITVSDWSADFISHTVRGSVDGETHEIVLGATLNLSDKEKNPAGVYDGTYAITFLYN